MTGRPSGFTQTVADSICERLAGGESLKSICLAGNADEPLMFFAGLCVPQWRSVRKVKEGEITVDLYGFLTTEPNAIVGPIHQKAMPAILRNQDEVETWLTAPWSEAKALQRPLPNDELVLLPPKQTS